MNIVPKTGGNSTTGSIAYAGSGKSLESDNFTDALKAQGLPTPMPLTGVYDLNGAVGGPLKKDRLWFFVNGRTQGSTRAIANVYYNLNAGDPTKWLYNPDLTKQAYNDRHGENTSARITWQATPRNKIGGFWDEQAICRKCTGLTTGITDPARVSPEARGTGPTKPLRVPQLTWSSPVTSRLLLDAGFGGIYYGWGNFERAPNPTHDLISVVEQCAGGLRGQRRHPRVWSIARRIGATTTRAPTTGGRRRRTSPARQPEGRIPGHLHDRLSGPGHQQPESAPTASTTASRTSSPSRSRPGSTTREAAGTRSSRRISGPLAG